MNLIFFKNKPFNFNIVLLVLSLFVLSSCSQMQHQSNQNNSNGPDRNVAQITQVAERELELELAFAADKIIVEGAATLPGAIKDELASINSAKSFDRPELNWKKLDGNQGYQKKIDNVTVRVMNPTDINDQNATSQSNPRKNSINKVVKVPILYSNSTQTTQNLQAQRSSNTPPGATANTSSSNALLICRNNSSLTETCNLLQIKNSLDGAKLSSAEIQLIFALKALLDAGFSKKEIATLIVDQSEKKICSLFSGPLNTLDEIAALNFAKVLLKAAEIKNKNSDITLRNAFEVAYGANILNLKEVDSVRSLASNSSCSTVTGLAALAIDSCPLNIEGEGVTCSDTELSSQASDGN